jgi:hypothetical protein
MNLRNNIPDLTEDTENTPVFLEALKKETSGFKVPAGYFDTLGNRVADRINKNPGHSVIESILPGLKRPLVWGPVMATVVVAALLLFFVPERKNTTIPATDEWTQLNMAYDPSYATEAVFAESHEIDAAIDGKELNFAEVSLSGQNEPTAEEISAFIKEHEMESELLNEY